MNIPTFDFRGSRFVNTDGTLSDVAQAFLDSLLTVLIKNAGNEGLVAPSMSNASPDLNLTKIQNNVIVSPTGIATYTCQFGTLMYDSTPLGPNVLKVALNDGLGKPIFKTILTA